MKSSMGIRELRRHIRFRPSGSAQLRVDGGVHIPCSIRDLSMGGAYLVREGSPSRPVQLEPGTRVRLRVQEPEHGGRYTLSAEVVRLEPNGGPGLAIRFVLTESSLDPIVSYVRSAGQNIGAPPEALETPVLHPRAPRNWTPVGRISRAVIKVASLGSLAGIAYVGLTWLDSTLF